MFLSGSTVGTTRRKLSALLEKERCELQWIFDYFRATLSCSMMRLSQVYLDLAKRAAPVLTLLGDNAYP
jgi:hypothetical protein